MELTQHQVNKIIEEAMTAAMESATKLLNERYGGKDAYACGFAWVNIYVKGSTKLGKMFKAAGVKRNDYEKCFQIWNPSKLNVQNVDVKEEGARAAADVFRKHGISAYAGSRLD